MKEDGEKMWVSVCVCVCVRQKKVRNSEGVGQKNQYTESKWNWDWETDRKKGHQTVKKKNRQKKHPTITKVEGRVRGSQYFHECILFCATVIHKIDINCLLISIKSLWFQYIFHLLIYKKNNYTQALEKWQKDKEILRFMHELLKSSLIFIMSETHILSN